MTVWETLHLAGFSARERGFVVLLPRGHADRLALSPSLLWLKPWALPGLVWPKVADTPLHLLPLLRPEESSQP